MATFKTRQDYYQKFKEIGKNLGLTGTTLEILSQLLAEAEFESEVEHIAFSNESSLSRATQYNSKIQLCMDRMYSVYRGQCPRVYLKFISQTYLNLQPLDKVYTSNAYSLYYLGYEEINPDTGEESGIEIYAPVVIPPTDRQYKIICLLASEKVDKELTLSSNTSVSQPGGINYIDWSESNLTNDIWVQIANPGDSFKKVQTTRIFPDHVKDTSVLFDLTIPDFGLRLFGDFIENMQVKMTAFKYCEIGGFNSGDLKNIKVPGTVPVDMAGEQDYTGVKINPESPRDTLKSVHYLANREKYNSGVLRSNSDLGLLLKEDFPDTVSSATYQFSGYTSPEVEIKTSYSSFSPLEFGFIQDSGEGVLLNGTTDSSEDTLLNVYGYWGIYGETGKIDMTNKIPSIKTPGFIYNTIRISRDTPGKLWIKILGRFECRVNMSEPVPTKTIENLSTDPVWVEISEPINFITAVSDTGNIYDIRLECQEKVIKDLDNLIDKDNFVPILNLYYIPKTSGSYLTSSQISDFISRRKNYYITNKINISPGIKYRVDINISLDLYQYSQLNVDELSTIISQDIFDQYQNTFDVDPESNKNEIISLISKISGVKQIKELTFSYYDSTGARCSHEEILNQEIPYYFNITSYINTILC